MFTRKCIILILKSNKKKENVSLMNCFFSPGVPSVKALGYKKAACSENFIEKDWSSAYLLMQIARGIMWDHIIKASLNI